MRLFIVLILCSFLANADDRIKYLNQANPSLILDSPHYDREVNCSEVYQTIVATIVIKDEEYYNANGWHFLDGSNTAVETTRTRREFIIFDNRFVPRGVYLLRINTVAYCNFQRIRENYKYVLIVN